MRLSQLSFKQLASLLIPTIALTTMSFQSSAQQQFSGINKIEYFNPKLNKDFVGNGFLIEHQGKTYAVTVKHTLLEAKTQGMDNIEIKDHIKHWYIHPNFQQDKHIKLGKLLNANPSEKIDMQILQQDWLLFEVEENHSTLAVLKLRETAIKKGEVLTAYGCSYANKSTCQQDVYPGSYVATENNNLRVSMPKLDLAKLRGLSGSPVLDSNNEVVGIVSNVLKAKSGEGFDFAPATISYLKQILPQN